MRVGWVPGSVLVRSVATASIYPRSRGVGEPVFFAVSIEIRIVSMVLAFFSPPNGLPQVESATPQCAMAQFGSLASTALTVLLDSGNQNECSSATAMLKSSFTAGAHDVSNLTLAVPI